MQRATILLFCFCVGLWSAPVSASSNCTRNEKELQFLYMTSAGEAFDSSGSAVGMIMAVRDINANSSILTNYTLTHTRVVDSQCERTVSLTRFVKRINDPCRKFIAVIGSGCSVATEPVAELSHFWGLSQVSYGSSAGVLKNRKRFPNYFQLYPSEENYIPAVAATIQYYGWTQVGVVTQKESLFTGSDIQLTELLKAVNITVLDSIQFESTEDPAFVNGIFAENARVFFLNMYENKARQAICAAYRKGLYGKYYRWIVFGWYDSEWWKETDLVDTFDCNVDEMDAIIEGSIAIQQYPINEAVNKSVIGNVSYNRFFELYRKEVMNYPEYNETYVAHIAYDATWTLALALDRVLQRIAQNDSTDCTSYGNGIITRLEDWDYTNSTTTCLIRSELAKTNFEGLTGYVNFDVNGTRLSSPVRIYQYRSGKLIQIARWNGGSYLNYTYLKGEGNNTVFPDGIPPDGKPVENISPFHTALIACVYVCGFAGLIFCVVCLVFTLMFRNKKIIRLTSPYLNFFIIVGTGMVYLSVFFRVYPYGKIENYQLIRSLFCGISMFVGFTGYTLAFGTILAKMWRVYYIFHSPSPNKKSLTDRHLMLMILIITSGMILILVVGLGIPATRPNAYIDDDSETSSHPDKRGITQNYFIYKCFNSSSIAWLILLYVYMSGLHIIALILAIQTRKVRIKILNDSKEVAAIIYITSIVLAELVIVSFTLTNFQNIYETLYCGGLIVAATVVLAVIFIPKMINLYRDPTGENIFDKSLAMSTIEIGKGGAINVVTDKDRIASLESQIQDLKSRLESKESSEQNGGAAVTFSSVVQEHSLTPINECEKRLSLSSEIDNKDYTESVAHIVVTDYDESDLSPSPRDDPKAFP